MAKKPVGEIGPYSVSGGPEGPQVERLDAGLPTNKEDLERYFAERFVSAFNERRTMPGVTIQNLRQQGTTDLDFRIDCWRADYLELAELTPLTEQFGRAARSSGQLNVLEYAEWIYEKIIRAKAERYGDTAGRTFLLLYPTFGQFLIHEAVLACLQSVCFWRGCRFAAVFVFMTSGVPIDGPLEVLHQVVPSAPGGRPCRPEQFAGVRYTNLDHFAVPEGAGLRFELSGPD